MANHFDFLKLSDEVLYAEKGEKHLFLRPSGPDWIVVNRNGAVLLSRCDGSSTIEDILGSMSIPETLQLETEVLFSEAQSRGILVDSASLEDENPEVVTREDQRRDKPSLGSIYLKLTNQCNLSCNYCYAQSGKPSDVLSLEDLKAIAGGVSSISRSVEYVLSGGEPLLNPYTLDFAEMVKASGNVVQILTNGTLINEKNAERISKVADMVKISLDGSSEEVHSATRGKNNFERVIRAIDLLVGLETNVIVAMTVTKENRSDIPKMVSRFGSRLALQPLFKAGRGQDKVDLSLTGLEYYDALASVDGVAPMGMIARTLESIRGRGVRRCALAEREISISETGDVYPCQLLHAEEFKAGNIRERSLTEIYYESPVLKRLRSVNVDTLSKCSACQLRYICGGACRARDFYEVGSIEEVGEFCEYEREAFINGIFESVELKSV
ncbi:MAG: radical SAM protein [Terracidiphilus sp.]|jgi:radical SAM protein with 4Fe4S-binding SPASM domain